MLHLAACIFALSGYGFMALSYVSVRPRGAVTTMDMFFILLSIQFGPHAVLPHPFREVALLVPEVYPYYAAGVGLAYFGIAFGLFLFGSLAGTRNARPFPFRGRDIGPRAIPIIIGVALVYILFFVAFQGFNLSRTLSYLNFFRGDSLYTYAELRRELYAEDAALSLTAVTRQSFSAIIYAVLIYASMHSKKWRLVLIAIALLLFVICCMQMNKFPVLYYSVITALVVFFNRAYKTGEFISAKAVAAALAGIVLFSLTLYTLYNLQYSDAIAAGLVTDDRVMFRVFSRPFTANHDALYLWFAHFPSTFEFVGFRNVTPVVKMFHLTYFSPMVEIPALYTRVTTTYQAGFIGSSYASFGYPGIVAFSVLVSAIVVAIVKFETRLDVRWQRVAYVSVVGMNFYFLSSRELHTALLSGGIVLAPLIFFVYRAVTRWFWAAASGRPSSLRSQPKGEAGSPLSPTALSTQRPRLPPPPRAE